ncbi:hypothetical protein HYY72_01165 [Candidatus Woesearchaeota archaeon]|nr:hypothetical protein [Candidatus Woesearchaeota archaeon]
MEAEERAVDGKLEDASSGGGNGISESPQGVSEPEKDKSTLYFIIISVAIIIVAAALFVFRNVQTEPPKSQTVNYNGFIFNYTEPLWITNWQSNGQVYILSLRFNPYQAENISIEGDEGWRANSEVYITFDPESEKYAYVALAASEISLSLANTFNITPIAACTANVTACSRRPIVTCADSSDNVSVIYLRDEGPTSIRIQKNCAIIRGEGVELVRASDRAVYQWYRIIRPKSP